MADVEIQQDVNNEISVGLNPRHRHDEVLAPMQLVGEATVGTARTSPKTSQSIVRAEFRCTQCPVQIVIEDVIDIATTTIMTSDKPDLTIEQRAVWTEPG